MSVAVLLGPVMTVGWLVSSALVKACIPGLGWTECFLIGAAVSPTDPVLASSVVKGHLSARPLPPSLFARKSDPRKPRSAEQHVPKHLRDLLVADSGINDGLALPFIQIPLLLILNDHDVTRTLRRWFLDIVLYEVLGACLLGAALGVVVRKALKNARRKKTIDRESLLVLSLAVAMVCTGLADLMGVSEFLTCFCAGTAANWCAFPPASCHFCISSLT